MQKKSGVRQSGGVMVQPAFFFAVVFPPPSSGPEVFPWPDCSGAGRTTDAHEAFIMKRVIGDMVGGDKFFQLRSVPGKQGVEFDDGIRFIPFHGCHILPVGRMFGADAGDPDFISLECSLERFHFSQVAAKFAVVDRLVETVWSVGADELLQRFFIGVIGGDGALVLLQRPAPGRISFRK